MLSFLILHGKKKGGRGVEKLSARGDGSGKRKRRDETICGSSAGRITSRDLARTWRGWTL